MFQLLTLDAISPAGLRRFASEKYALCSADQSPPRDSDAILLRSSKLSIEQIKAATLVVARVGAGVNNIPVDYCNAKGIPVFNTPGANANAVKELVLAVLLLLSRDIIGGITYVRSLDDSMDFGDLVRQVEREKKRFKGSELTGKILGLVGLGAIGCLVAETALMLGMRVCGYDPSLSVQSALCLPKEIERVDDIASLVSRADYVSVHVPLLESTRGLFSKELFSEFKPGARLLNFARSEIVNVEDLVSALDSDLLAAYAADFPHPSLVARDDVILLPHLGASTREAEENCAVMAAELLKDFLEHGNIKNSVNFPAIHLEPTENKRISISNHNVPRMINQITQILADANINVIDMLNKSRGEIAYNLIDVETDPGDTVIAKLQAIPKILKVRLLG